MIKFEEWIRVKPGSQQAELLEVDPELEVYLPCATDLCESELERQLVEQGGPRDPIRVWREMNMVVDGHRRLRICLKQKLGFAIEYLSFPTKDHVKYWMDCFQAARRNLTPHENSLRIARIHDFLKRGIGPDRVRSERGGGKVENLAADEAGVSRQTVQRASKYAQAFKDLSEEIRARVSKGTLKASRKAVISLGTLDHIQQREIVSLVDSGQYKNLQEAIFGECANDDSEASDPSVDELLAEPETPPETPRAEFEADLKEAMKRIGGVNKQADILKQRYPNAASHRAVIEKMNEVADLFRGWVRS